jgi:hypothetical protein
MVVVETRIRHKLGGARAPYLTIRTASRLTYPHKISANENRGRSE